MVNYPDDWTQRPAVEMFSTPLATGYWMQRVRPEPVNRHEKRLRESVRRSNKTLRKVPAWVTLALVFALSGCDRMAMLVKPEPYKVWGTDDQAEERRKQCETPCVEPQDLQDGDGNTLLAVSKLNRAQQAICITRHDACKQALDRLRAARVIE